VEECFLGKFKALSSVPSTGKKKKSKRKKIGKKNKATKNSLKMPGVVVCAQPGQYRKTPTSK
jgi:ribosomal protein L32